MVFVTYLTPVQNQHSREHCGGNINRQSKIGLTGPWNTLASFLGITVGIITMAANEEQAKVVEDWGLGISSLFMVLLATGMSIMGCKS